MMAAIRLLGTFEEAPKKTYISLRRKNQFAMVGPAPKSSIEIGLNGKDLAPHTRLKLQPPGSMCHVTTRISDKSELDDSHAGWLKKAYEAAG
jgi:Domain of unknown function (DUF5655)